MFIYNTLSKKNEEFKPIKNSEVGIYTCGPTVYHYAHIGNMRTYIAEDFLRRSLEFLGYKVNHVMNITDVGHLTSDADEGEDKIELSAKKQGKSAYEIADFYTSAFFKHFDSLNCLRPSVSCKATEHIKEMIELILKLEKNGYTYKTSDGIYYDTSKFKDYGSLVGKAHIEGLKAGARVEMSAEKKNPSDFSLWKFSPKNEKRQMEWDSPWGKGFPGWHIECSAMSMKYLGETFDIHCGGVDHIPIHHSNEIAQAEGATGKKFVNYWVHMEFLVLKAGDKMSKSAGNFLTLDSVTEKGYSPLAYRYFCSQAHYRKQLEFSFEALDSASKGLKNLKSAVSDIQEKTGGAKKENNSSKHLDNFKKALQDDINIPKAVAVLWEALKDSSVEPAERLWLAGEFDKVLAFGLFDFKKEELPPEIKNLCEERTLAKKNKDFKKADELREKIKSLGWLVEDTPAGPKVKKI
ncbi:MAG: cysteine--tRNA ligase [Elusimicrobia bacterium]|nr:cysteine--tRNA ligase [Elusimicrobiota bacterium]